MSITAAKGFVAAGTACGIKASGDPDLALVATADGEPVPAAAVFTSNKMTAAPVVTSASHLADGGNRAVEKAMMTLRGYDVGPPRRPNLPFPSDRLSALRQDMERAGLL